MMKGLLALLMFAGVNAFAAEEKFSPAIGPDADTPKVSLRFNRANGTVDVHSNGRWMRAKHFDAGMHANKVEVSPKDSEADASVLGWLSNFFYGDYYYYGSYYPQNYYYYTPSYSLWYNNYSYYPYNYYDRGYYSYYTYYW